MKVINLDSIGRTLLALTFLALLLPVAQADASNKWRIKINYPADSDGELVFRVNAENDPPIDVSVTIGKGAGENRVANDVESAFKKTLPGDMFRVERDDLEDVLVQKAFAKQDFDLELISNTAKGVNVRIHKE